MRTAGCEAQGIKLTLSKEADRDFAPVNLNTPIVGVTIS